METTDPASTLINVNFAERTFPPYDEFHATPDAMLWRRAIIDTSRGRAVFEQTDYGHPGRLNPWESRGIASGLLPRLAQLRAAVEAVAALA